MQQRQQQQQFRETLDSLPISQVTGQQYLFYVRQRKNILSPAKLGAI